METSRRGSEEPHALYRATPAELIKLRVIKRRGVPFISWRDAKGALQLRALDPTVDVTIGRGDGCDVVFDWDEQVSSLHAQLQAVGGDWLIVDDGLSLNGTEVNGERVRGRRRLRSEDRIRVGDRVLVFHAPITQPVPTTVAAQRRLRRGDFDRLDHGVLRELCRPCVESATATPASNAEIAARLCIAEDTVKKRLRILYGRFGITGISRGQKRLALVARTLESGLVTPQDYAS